ncbi:MAG: tRNA uridine-5-carboxymethylaminomethyl(34) synthesis enzyme MnmG [Bacteriovoracales bacterium]|nr:tRNA uridine-5-carboxymethylaminomethyl(34) synthesis enzyme MnmG [Bacteriovoracales bacterium]
METKVFDILVVGGGHAGIEAAHIAAQFGLEVGLLSMPGVPLGSTPCNPSIGGVGKGQVVREIDTLGGLMGKIADRSAIHYRTLNESKGYALRSTRVQIDRKRYEKVAEEELAKTGGLSIIRVRVERIERDQGLFCVRGEGRSYPAKKLIVTAGTFLAGRLHLGNEQRDGGRMGHPASLGMGNLFGEVETLPLKFKTGTPPRIERSSIDFSSLREQPSDSKSGTFHWKNEKAKRSCPQRSCFITATNAKTLKIIRDHRAESPLFNGQIQGIGPRYCPSIEDKAYRYPERNTHHIFLEPEGLESKAVYPSGISTSLPKDVQLSFLKTIEGLESVEVLAYGYAVEYDVVNTAKLDLSLEYREIPGLYFAGQVNGTSGYEEAAAQGLVAGINAAHSLLGRKPFRIRRDASYVGVLIDDLVGQKRDEPYRLFTARNENRLYVREDNTFLRMAPYRMGLGLKEDLDTRLKALLEEHEILTDLLDHYVFREKTHGELFRALGLGVQGFSGGGVRLASLVKNPKSDAMNILHKTLERSGLSFSHEVAETVVIGEIYRGYIEKSHREWARQRNLDYAPLKIDALLDSHNISFECKQRIRKAKPETFAQLKKIEGIRPATLATISGRL